MGFWRYRNWLILLLCAVAAMAAYDHYLGHQAKPATAEAFSKEAVAALRSQPWPADSAARAGLVASLRALGARALADDLQQLHAYGAAKALLSEPVPAYATVGEGLDAIQAMRGPGASGELDLSDLMHRLVEHLIDVRLADPSP